MNRLEIFFTKRFVKNESWNKIGNLIQRREGHFSWEYEGEKIISCGGQNLAKLYASCEAFDLEGKNLGPWLVACSLEVPEILSV